MRPNLGEAYNLGDHGGILNISKEELKIRGELEDDIERDLEAEIKDGICHLALRLHRLYQHQRDRSARESLIPSSSSMNNNMLSEMNIRIRMEGGSKIEISEIKKETNGEKGIRPQTSSSPSISEVYKQGKALNLVGGEFNWAKTLRSRERPLTSGATSKKNEPKISRSNNVLPNAEHRKNCMRVSSARQQMNGEAYAEETKFLELGWKS